MFAKCSDEMSLEERWPNLYDQLLDVREILESNFRDVCDFEFVVEQGRLYILNARPAKRTPEANLSFALQFFQEGKIGLSEAVGRVSPTDIEALVRPEITNKAALHKLGIGLPASPGAATGRLAISLEKVEELCGRGQDFIFVRVEVSPEDMDAMHSSKGVLTELGGMTSHAAVACRGLKKPCVAGFGEMDILYMRGEVFVLGQRLLREGDWITIDGSTGKVYFGKGEVKRPDWRQCPELLMLAQMIDHAIISGEIDLATVGLTWRIRDYFLHSRPLCTIRSSKRPVHRRTYTSFSPPKANDLRSARKVLCPLAPQERENYSEIVFGLSEALSRLLASRLGFGNHHQYLRPLWDPETTCGLNKEEELAQLVGFEYFGINRNVRHLPDISRLTFLLEVELRSKDDRWFLDFTNPKGESLVPDSEVLLGYRLFVNGAPVKHRDVPSLYNCLRRREYYWRWFEYNKTSHEEIIEFLESGRYKSRPESRLTLYCEELGLLSHGELTPVGLSIVVKDGGGDAYEFF